LLHRLTGGILPSFAIAQPLECRMTRTTIFTLFLALFLTLPSVAQDANITVPHERIVLPNGLTVILHEDHTTPMVARPNRVRAPLRAHHVRGLRQRRGGQVR
jgi:hypothetical protein